MTLVHKFMTSPVGELKLVAGPRGLVAVLWEDDDPRRVPLEPSSADDRHPALLEAERQLADYFSGARRAFAVDLDFRGTPFQRSVWRALIAIPYGETRSYGDIARSLGTPNAVRAVGAANGRNPMSIIAPCHRVVGSTGKLTGFAGGLKAKAWLLDHERGPSGDRLI